MNTVRILICATFALLIAALVHSYTTRGWTKEPSISDLKEELARVRAENRIQREHASSTPVPYNQLGSAYSPTTIDAPFNLPPASTSNIPTEVISDETLAKIDALEIENAELKAKQSQQESEASLIEQQTDLSEFNDEPDDARAALISQALVMAKVREYASEEQIIVLDLVRARNITTGQVLGIRRGKRAGIIGRIKMGRIEDSQLGYADPIIESFFGGPIDIKIGDEIIVIP